MNNTRINKFIKLEIEHDAQREVFGNLEMLINQLRTKAEETGFSSLEKATYLVAALEVEKIQGRVRKAWYSKKDQLKAA